LDVKLSDLITDQKQVNNLQILPIDLTHIYALENLPNEHRDPFDRITIAQAMVEKNAILEC
jgi:PIN domain nuclease of toxin-antitoxin system